MSEYPKQKIRLMVKAYRDKLDYIDRWDRDESGRADEWGMIAALEAAEKWDADPEKAKAEVIAEFEQKIRTEEITIIGYKNGIERDLREGNYEGAASLKKFIGWSESSIAKYKKEIEFLNG